MIFKYFIFCLIVALFISCDTKSNKDGEDQIDNKTSKINKKEAINSTVKQAYRTLGIKEFHTLKVNGNHLFLDVVFTEGYFLRAPTNNTVFNYVLFKMDTLLNNVDSVSYKYAFVDLTGFVVFNMSKEYFVEEAQKFENNPLYQKMVRYALDTLQADEVVIFNKIIRDARKKYLKGKFKFKGSFTQLLYKYSKNCCNEKSKYNYYMQKVHRGSAYPKAPNRPEVVEKLIEMCENHCQ
jgi:hypothetical protein